jgi:hypothetical protein
MASNNPEDAKHFKPVPLSQVEQRMLMLEDKLDDALEILEKMPNDHKNCTVANYEHARAALRIHLTY